MSADRPLEGITVIDFTRIYSGPYCSLLLADLGAEVIKVEKMGFGDDSRHFRPKPNTREGSGYYMYINRNKKSIELDLKDDRAKAIIYRLSKKADIVLENYAPGVADKLGVGYEEIRKHNPKIIYGSISGFGQTGPYKSKPAYDIIAQAMGGYMAVSGPKNGMPIKLGTSVGDSCAGLHMAFALMAAMYYRERTGIGQYIDISMMDSVFATLENHVMIQTMDHITPTRNGNSNQNAVPFNTFQTSDGYVAIAVANDTLFQKFADAIERPDLVEHPDYKLTNDRKLHEDALTKIVEDWTKQRTAQEVCDRMEAFKVPVGPILGIDELVDNPHILAREMMIEVDHPYAGKIRMPGCPIKFSETKIERFDPSPALGADTVEILKTYGDYTDEEIENFQRDGVILP